MEIKMHQPKTIEELRQWYIDRNLPPEEVTRFFIGKNILEPKAFGIYENEFHEFVVYKNKADGERAIRYQGPDEAFAVKELQDRLKQEILNQKSRNGRSPSAKTDDCQNTSFSKIKLFFFVLGDMLFFFMLIAFLYLAFGPGDEHTYYIYKDKYYYCDDSHQWTYLNEDDEWIPLKNPGIKYFFFDEHPLSLTYIFSNAYVIGENVFYKSPKNQNTFYKYNEATNQWENTPVTNAVLSAYATHNIIEIHSTDYFNYHDRLFQFDGGEIYVYNESTRTFEKTDEVLDCIDFIKNYRDYSIDVKKGFYLYDNTLYHTPYTTCWKAYNEASTDYSKWDEVAVDKELILNSENYYVCDDWRGYYQFGDVLCYYQHEEWYRYQNDAWEEINPNELATLCLEKITYIEPEKDTEKEKKNHKEDYYYPSYLDVLYYSQLDPSWNVTDFTESKYYDEPTSIKSGSSSSSDSSYNWDSGSSWDSGATDWNSNW